MFGCDYVIHQGVAIKGRCVEELGGNGASTDDHLATAQGQECFVH